MERFIEGFKDAVIHAKELIESKQSYGLEHVIAGKEVWEGIGTVMITDMAIDGIFGARIRRNDKS